MSLGQCLINYFRRILKTVLFFNLRPRSGNSKTLQGWGLLKSAYCIVVCLTVMTDAALGQSIKHTENTVDSSMRGSLQVDPSTLGMTLEIPLGEYPGRNGLSVPIALSYGSKLWRMETVEGFPGTAAYHTQSEARFAEHSVSGWTSSLDIPEIEYLGAEQPFSYPSGAPLCTYCEPPTSETPYYVDRILVHMPDGSSHELRKSDIPVTGGALALTGLYYAVDGSRLKFDADTATLYMPDGSRYLFAPSIGDIQYIDRNGNRLTYNSSLKQWTDTMGRAINLPPLINTVTGSRSYGIPGFGSSTRNISLVWRNLSQALTDPSQPLRYKGNKNCPGYPETTVTPSLFTSLPVTDSVCYGGPLFNPIVLWKVQFPGGTAYTFTYNIYGEIDKVILPTGGYERFHYEAIDSVGTQALGSIYGQANRGVVEHWVSAKGDGSDEVRWQYSAINNSSNTYVTSVIGPSGSRSERSIYTGSTPEAPTSKYGFEDCRAGRAYEERTYASNGQMIRRTLVEWSMTQSQLPAPFQPTTVTRDPRATKKVEILLDTGGGNAPAAITTTAYDADLNEIESKRYDYVSINQANAQTDGISSFPLGTLLRTEETVYVVNDTNVANRNDYRNRHLIALPSYTRVKNGSTIVAETQFKYDESAYPILTYSGLSPSPPGWTDPGTTIRGNVTTVRRWLNMSGGSVQTYPSGSFLETHSKYDQFGNLYLAYDASGIATQTFYTDAFSDSVNRSTYALATSIRMPAPDLSGTYGTSLFLTTNSTYDFQSGKVVSTTDPNNQTTTYSYAINGLTAYDPFLRLCRVTRPGGLGKTDYFYSDLPGDISNYTSVSQNSSTLVEDGVLFDGLGRPYRSGHSESSTQWSIKDTEYDSLGRVERVSNPYFASTMDGPTNPSGVWTSTSYDDLNRPLTITMPDGSIVSTVYSGNQVATTDPTSKTRRSITNALGRLAQVAEDPSGLNYQTNYTYDVLGNLITVQQGTQSRYFFYDSLSRLVRTKNPEQDINSSLALTTNPPAYNNSWSLGYIYDPNGNVQTRTDARGITTNYAYDRINRSTTITYTDSTPSVERHYDGATLGMGRFHYSYSGGNFSTGTTVEHTVIDSYDALGRPLTGRQLFKTGGTWGQTFNFSRSYDWAGHITQQAYPSSRTVNHTYNSGGRLASTSGNLGGTSYTYADTITYTPSGQMASERFGTGTSTSLYHASGYNSRLQLVETRLGTGTDWANTASWNRGRLRFYLSDAARGADNPWVESSSNNGNISAQDHEVPLTVDASSGSVTSSAITMRDDYYYDSLSRLINVQGFQLPAGGSWNNVYTQTFSYDRWGNRLSVMGSNAQSWDTSEAAATNRLRVPGTTGCPASGTRVCYDAAGNLIFDNTLGSTGTRSYDAENRITAAAGSGANSYVYNADGKRTRRLVGAQIFFQIYGFDGELLAEYLWNGSTASLQKEYGSRGGETLIVAEGATVRWLVKDHLGTPRILTDQTGSLPGITRHDYFPFGEDNLQGPLHVGNGYSSADNVRHKFTVYEHDNETNLDYAQARYYANLQGRFTSIDPLNASAEPIDPQSWNRYSYVINQPTVYTDPLGLFATKYYIDGIEASAEEVRKFISAGWAVIAPADVVRYNSNLFNGRGGFEHFKFTGDGRAGWGYYSSVALSFVDGETDEVIQTFPGHVEFHLTRSLGRTAEFQGELAFQAGGQYFNATGGIIGESHIEMQMLGPLDYIGPVEAKALLSGGAFVFGSLAKVELNLGIHAVEQMAEREITEKMIEVALRKGQPFYDPKNKAINYVLEQGFASGKSLLVGQNPVSKKITTVISGRKLVSRRFIPLK